MGAIWSMGVCKVLSMGEGLYRGMLMFCRGEVGFGFNGLGDLGWFDGLFLL